MDCWLEPVSRRSVVIWRSGLLGLLLLAGCGLPSELDGTWRTNILDQDFERPEACGDGRLHADEECDDGNRENDDGCNEACRLEGGGGGDPVCGDGNLDEGEGCDDGNTVDGDGCDKNCAEEGTQPASCGNGRVDENEECDDGNQDADDLCDNDCQHRDCGGGDDDVIGDKGCKALDEEAVCVVGDGHPVCRLRDMDYDPPEFLREALFRYCADSDEGGIPDNGELCNKDEDCHHGQRCYMFDTPEEYQGLCWVSEAPNNSDQRPALPMVPGWAVRQPESADGPPHCTAMACVGTHEQDFCRVREALRSEPLSAYCSDTISDDVRDQAGTAVCVLAECTGNNEHVSRSCTEIFSMSGASCNLDGYCVGVGNNDDRMCSDEDFPHVCEDTCQQERCRDCHGHECQGCGGAAFDLCEWTDAMNEPACLACQSDDDCPEVGAGYRCYKPPGSPGGTPGTCRLRCEIEEDCAFRPGGRCVGMGGGQKFCELQSEPHQGPGCGRDEDCQFHEVCNNGGCAPRQCPNGNECPDGTRCNDNGQCEPEQGGGPDMNQICTRDNDCGAERFCDSHDENQPGICLPHNCHERACPGGYICLDDGNCQGIWGCEENQEDACGPAMGLTECDGIPEHAGGRICVIDSTRNGGCQSDDDCPGSSVCQPNMSRCIQWGPACNDLPGGAFTYTHYCSMRRQEPPLDCNPQAQQNNCPNGQLCMQAQETVDRQAMNNRGVCGGQPCEHHGDCRNGQFCVEDGQVNRCKQRTLCNGYPDNGGQAANFAVCDGARLCVGPNEAGLLAESFCAKDNGICTNDQECHQFSGARCANGVCTYPGHPGSCEAGFSPYSGVCMPARWDGQDDHENDYTNVNGLAALGVDEVLTFDLHSGDQDAFLFTNTTGSAANFAVAIQDPNRGFDVACLLYDPGQHWIVASARSDAGACALQAARGPDEQFVVVVHRLDVLAPHTLTELTVLVTD